jgi:MFS family permease
MPMQMERSRIDTIILFITRTVRLFAYGFLSITLALYLSQIGLSDKQIGLLLSLILVGDIPITLWITTSADRIGRRRMLVLGALLMLLGGVAFILTNNIVLLMFAAIIGVISPSGNEIGPFLAIEQAGLSQLVPDSRRTQVFAWYNLVGSFATALGALAGGVLVQSLQHIGFTPLDSYRAILIGYAIGGVLLALMFLGLSPAVEASSVVEVSKTPRLLGLHRSRNAVIKLSMLFSLDAFAGGFIVQSLMAYWFHIKFGIDAAVLGSIFFGANVLAGISALSATHIAKRIGLINTMVFTHIPSNILLCLVPFMPNLTSAIVLLLLRFSISQMDVPARQSYTMAIVSPDERSAASGVTSIARSVGASVSPTLAGLMLANPLFFSAPFLVSGGLKIVYDLLVYRSFSKTKPPEESAKG